MKDLDLSRPFPGPVRVVKCHWLFMPSVVCSMFSGPWHWAQRSISFDDFQTGSGCLPVSGLINDGKGFVHVSVPLGDLGLAMRRNSRSRSLSK